MLDKNFITVFGELLNILKKISGIISGFFSRTLKKISSRNWYFLFISNKYNLKVVLINPAVYPWSTIDSNRSDENDLATCYYDNSKFEFNHSHIQSLRKYEVNMIKNPKNILTLLQCEDEVLDYTQAEEKLFETNLEIEEGGNHSFDGIERYFRKVSNFFNS